MSDNQKSPRIEKAQQLFEITRNINELVLDEARIYNEYEKRHITGERYTQAKQEMKATEEALIFLKNVILLELNDYIENSKQENPEEENVNYSYAREVVNVFETPKPNYSICRHEGTKKWFITYLSAPLKLGRSVRIFDKLDLAKEYFLLQYSEGLRGDIVHEYGRYAKWVKPNAN